MASVIEDFEGAIDGVLLGTPSRIGLESTVVDCLSQPPRVLRPGAISLAQLQTVDSSFVMAGKSHQPGDNSPGRLHPHYRPRARVHLFDDAHQLIAHKSAAYLARESHGQPQAWGWHKVFGSVDEYAAEFYECLREADRRGLAEIYLQSTSETGTGAALMDRMRRSAEDC